MTITSSPEATATAVAVRLATPDDLDAFVRLEQSGFSASDRFSRDQLRRLIARASSTAFVAETPRAPEDGGDAIAGAAIMLWRSNSPVGRLYSIVTDPARQGRGVGGALLAACEDAAAARGCTRLALEVRVDNPSAIRLYQRHGYQAGKTVEDYYADGTAALRMEKRLTAPAGPRAGVRLRVPYYKQTLEFTCGPACLMMAFKHFTPSLHLDRSLELKLWKEATLIFMTSGLGGCGPFGLAVAAQRRGLQARVVVSSNRVPFLSSVRSDEKKDVIRLVHEQLKDEAAELGVETDYYPFRFEHVTQALRQGEVPIVLVSAYRRHRVRAPHWVVVTGFDAENVYLHDPYEGYYESKRGRDVRIPISEFRQMRKYGKEVQRSMVVLSRPTAG